MSPMQLLQELVEWRTMGSEVSTLASRTATSSLSRVVRGGGNPWSVASIESKKIFVDEVFDLAVNNHNCSETTQKLKNRDNTYYIQVTHSIVRSPRRRIDCQCLRHHTSVMLPIGQRVTPNFSQLQPASDYDFKDGRSNFWTEDPTVSWYGSDGHVSPLPPLLTGRNLSRRGRTAMHQLFACNATNRFDRSFGRSSNCCVWRTKQGKFKMFTEWITCRLLQANNYISMDSCPLYSHTHQC